MKNLQGYPLRKVINSRAIYNLGEFRARDYHLVFSPDDLGWYWERADDWKTSQLFKTNVEAVETMKTELEKSGAITWE